MKIITGVFATTVLGITVLQLSLNKSFDVIRPRGTDYSLNFAGKQISDATASYSGEKTATVYTGRGNALTIKAANVIVNNDGWQTVLPGGYFYNPIDGTTDHNKISGMSSIGFTAESATTLSLHYGYTANDSSIIYSHKVSLEANTPYSFVDGAPSYFYLRNDGSSNVDITDFSINYTCVDQGYNKQDLNVLMIGNSFSDDTIYYASQIANSYGITVNVFDAYVASCTIDMHYNYLTNNSAVYTGKTVSGGSFVNLTDKTLTEILNYKTWDIITFQQGSAVSGLTSSYSHLEDLVEGVRAIVGNTPIFDWYQTWSYDSGLMDSSTDFSQYGNDNVAMFNAINTAYTSEVDSLGVFNKLIPAGTVVQNTRTSYMKETFTKDFRHMSSFHGRYLLGLNFISNVLDIDLDMSPCTYRPTQIDESFLNVAKESIRNAYKTPLAVTNSVYTVREIANHDLSLYTEIDAELVGCSYWNSTDSNNYNKRISNSSGSSIQYVTTKRFTSSTLPVGSLVVIGDTFGVRPEAWVTDAQQSTRPDETFDNVIEITSSFFSGYAYRAFNIFKQGASGKESLKGQFNQVFDTFHIYVPNNSMAGLTPKSTNAAYASDKAVLKSNLINIDAFERLHLDPITGFYHCTNYADLTNSYVDDTAKKFMCSVPFFSANGDLPENTLIIVDGGYQWRSDAWGDHGKAASRPNNVTTNYTLLDASFWTGFRVRTFNVSSTSSSYVGQDYINFFNHMRIYLPVSDDIYLEPEDTLTMTVLGNAQAGSTLKNYGYDKISIMITLTGDDTTHVVLKVLGDSVETSGYSYNKSTGKLSIQTVGYIITSPINIAIGTLSGDVDRDNEVISNITASGNIGSLLTDNGSITCSSVYHNRCNQTTDAATQNIWQRRYWQNGSWQYNSGTGQWTTANSTYHMEEDYSTGLRIANNTYTKTSFFLKNDLGNGSGITARHFSIWLFNPNGDFIKNFTFYIYKNASTETSGANAHKVPGTNYASVHSVSTIATGEWVNIQCGFTATTIYNFSLYFEVKNDVTATNYLYLGHVSIL